MQTVKVDRNRQRLSDLQVFCNRQTLATTIELVSELDPPFHFRRLPSNEANDNMLLVLGALVYNYFSSPTIDRSSR